jgi:hypothetical protein
MSGGYLAGGSGTIENYQYLGLRSVIQNLRPEASGVGPEPAIPHRRAQADTPTKKSVTPMAFTEYAVRNLIVPADLINELAGLGIDALRNWADEQNLKLRIQTFKNAGFSDAEAEEMARYFFTSGFEVIEDE